MTDLLERQSPASERPRIDPRIAQRWIDARRQEGRRRLHVMVIASAVVACVALAAGSLYTPLFQVRHVRVAVEGPMPAATIAAWSGVSRRTQTIDVDARAVAARLDAHPALGAARVARHWPGTVTIAVSVRTPMADVAVPSGYAEVDATGRVLAYLASAPPGTPLLQGAPPAPAPGGWLKGSAGAAAPPNSPPSGLVDMAALSDGPDVPSGPAAALAFLDALPPLLRSDVSSISVDRGAALSLVVSPPRSASGTITVLLGDGSQLQAKAAALVAILDEGDLSGVAGLDLTVPSRPATAASLAGLSPRAATTGSAAPVGASTGGGAAASGGAHG